jgi:alpha-L-fucosidase 2
MLISESRILSPAAFNGTTVSVDYASYLAQHDVVYKVPPLTGEQGMPIGDGDLGVMIWCPPGEIRMQVNKSDIWWENPYPHPGREQDWRQLSAAGLCIRTDPSPLDNMDRFEQRLNIYQGLVHLEASAPAGACTVQAWVPQIGGVLCVNYQDTMLKAKERYIELNAWRNARVFAMNDRIGLIEKLPNLSYAMVFRLSGGNFKAKLKDSTIARLEVSSPRGVRFTLYAGIAVSDPEHDPVALANARVEQAMRRGAELLLQDHRAYWRAFWQKSFLSLDSPDDAAKYLENLWYLYHYQLNCCSRGMYAPLANGGLWLTNRDTRPGEGVYRHSRTQPLFWPTFASNHLELASSYFETYMRMVPAAARQTQERFKTQGLRFPEAANRLGEEVAAPDDSRLQNRHSAGLECAMLFWWCWQHTHDLEILRSRAYPLLKACVKFYMEMAARAPQGRLSLFDAHKNDDAPEGGKDAPVSIQELAGLRFCLKALLEASDFLETDEEEAPRWREFLESLPDYPADPATGIWIEGEGGEGQPEDGSRELSPVFPSGLVGIGSAEHTQAVRTFLYGGREHIPFGWSRDAIIAARLGLRETVSDLLLQHVEKFQIFPQGFFHYLRKSAIDPDDHIPYLDSLGVIATALNEMCVQGHDGTIRVFPALPPGWNATFMLRTAGGFLVMAQTYKASPLWVAVMSLTGSRCQICNPWEEMTRVLDGRIEIMRSRERILSFPTEVRRVYVLEPYSRSLSRMPRIRLSGRRNTSTKHLGRRQIGLP